MLRDFAALGRAVAAMLGLALAVSACGIKGPLKLPPPPPPAAPSAPAAATDSPAPPAPDESTPGKKP
jgi:predicted small lipoprotein YifL